MTLYIDTTKGALVRLISDGRIIVEIISDKTGKQSEELLTLIESALTKSKITLDDIGLIEVENRGGSFTSLRIGVATANALAFAMKIPVKSVEGETRSMVLPEYSREPEIGIKRANKKLVS